MEVSPREEFAGVLAEVAAPAATGTRLQVGAGELSLRVAGVGQIGLPLSAAQAEALCAVGRPARFGRGERTLTDRRVRDTWEIPTDLVQVEWSDAFEPALEKIRRGLDLPPGSRIAAELHSVLVYEPGNFFLPHQDSEKDDAMVATLVVTVPSTHTGGELVVHHGGLATTYRGSRTKITMVAFYADCLHEVRPLSSGYRLALTYNLLLDAVPDGSAAADPASELAVARLTEPLRQHLTMRRRHRYRDELLDPPNRLVFLLDHEYTERGLNWARLKGADARRAALVRSAAAAADCEVALALAEIQETWDALEPDTRYTRRRWSDDPARDSGPEDYELQYLIDSSIRLTRWTDPAGTWAETIGLALDEDEVCTTTPTVQLRPYESEFEGYMGNYGNTMDRWYRRAALIVWPRVRSFEIRSEISPGQALDELVGLVRSARPSDREQARTAARRAAATLAPFWDAAVRSQDQARFLPKALRAATVLEDADAAGTLLRPFRVETLRPSHVKTLTKLAERHGPQWTGDLLRAWFGDARQPYRVAATGEDRSRWSSRLPALAAALSAEGDRGLAVGRQLLGLTWDHLSAQIDLWLDGRPSHLRAQLAPLGEPLAALLHAAAVLDAADLPGRIIAELRRRPDAVVVCELRALRTAEPLPADLRRSSALPDLARDCAARLRARLSRPPRADDDWSLDLPAGCDCELCVELEAFLRDPEMTTLEWPLAQQRRGHVHHRIDSAELPVTHQTRRRGRPFTLVLTKQRALFDQERSARTQDRTDLDWLEGIWAATARR